MWNGCGIVGAYIVATVTITYSIKNYTYTPLYHHA